MLITWTKYIFPEEREQYERLGWKVEDKLGHPHGQFSYLAIWENSTDPPLPETAND